MSCGNKAILNKAHYHLQRRQQQHALQIDSGSSRNPERQNVAYPAAEQSAGSQRQNDGRCLPNAERAKLRHAGPGTGGGAAADKHEGGSQNAGADDHHARQQCP
jgi:hypothetical protein